MVEKLRRFDLALDVKLPVSLIHKNFDTLKQYVFNNQTFFNTKKYFV